MKRIAIIYFVFSIISIAIYAQTAQNFSKADVDAATYTLYDELTNGKAVVLDFMGTWCASCQGHVPALEQIFIDYGSGSQAWVWAVDIYDNESAQQIKDFRTSMGITYKIFPQGSSIGTLYGVTGIPHFVVVCPNKTIAYNKSGWTTKSDQDIRNAVTNCITTGITENNNSLTRKVKIVPNPASDYIKVIFSNDVVSSINIDIFDILGKKVYTARYDKVPKSTNQIPVNISNLPAGVYLMSTLIDDDIQTLRFTVKN